MPVHIKWCSRQKSTSQTFLLPPAAHKYTSIRTVLYLKRFYTLVIADVRLRKVLPWCKSTCVTLGGMKYCSNMRKRSVVWFAPSKPKPPNSYFITSQKYPKMQLKLYYLSICIGDDGHISILMLQSIVNIAFECSHYFHSEFWFRSRGYKLSQVNILKKLQDYYWY